MAKSTIAARLAALEAEVAELKARLDGKKQSSDWSATIAKMQASGVGAIMKEALKIRERDRQKARRRKKVAS